MQRLSERRGDLDGQTPKSLGGEGPGRGGGGRVFGLRRGIGREHKGEGGALALAGRKGDRSAVLLDDPACDGQAQARAAGLVVWKVRRSVAGAGGHARAVIDDVDALAAASSRRESPDRCFPLIPRHPSPQVRTRP